MRKIIIVLSCLLLVCLFSCSDNNKIIQDRHNIDNVSESISSSYEVSKDTQINLSNLESCWGRPENANRGREIKAKRRRETSTRKQDRPFKHSI